MTSTVGSKRVTENFREARDVEATRPVGGESVIIKTETGGGGDIARENTVTIMTDRRIIVDEMRL